MVGHSAELALYHDQSVRKDPDEAAVGLTDDGMKDTTYALGESRVCRPSWGSRVYFSGG